MKWTITGATNELTELLELQGSESKLRWYVRQDSLLRSDDGKFIKMSVKQIHDIKLRIKKFRSQMLSYAEIVEKASFEFKQEIRNISGIYFLIDSTRPKGHEIVYVGQAKSIMHRLSGHFWKVDKKFDKVYFIEPVFQKTDLNVLDREEAFYIWHLETLYYNLE